MKKVFFYIFIIICLTFLFPVILTSRITSVETTGNIENNIETQYNYKEYGTINLINTETNEVSEIQLDEYLLRSGK